jgi:hypothetical protein
MCTIRVQYVAHMGPYVHIMGPSWAHRGRPQATLTSPATSVVYPPNPHDFHLRPYWPNMPCDSLSRFYRKCVNECCGIFGGIFGQLLVAVWLLSGCFLVVARCCGSCAPTNACCCGICCGIFVGICCGIVCGIFDQLLVSFWLLSVCFLDAFWLFVLCCGSCAPTNALFSGICFGFCCGICCWFLCRIFGQLLLAFWLMSGCFQVAFWLFAFCCGRCAPTNDLCGGICCGICGGICYGICCGIVGQLLVAFWLRSGCFLVAVGLFALCCGSCAHTNALCCGIC